MSRFRLLVLVLAACAIFSSPASARHAGDRVFDTARVHEINVVFDVPWREANMRLQANKEKEIYIPARMEINCVAPDTSGCVRMDSVGVRFKGNSSYSSARQKNPFRFSFDEFGIDQRWDGLKGFVLNNGWGDGTFAREKLHLDFARRAGFPGPRGTYAWLSVNGERYGFYLMVELVDKRFLESRFGDKEGDRFKATDIIGNARRSDFTRRTPYTPEAYHGYYEANSDDTARAWARIARFVDDLNLPPEDSIATVLPSIVNVDDLYRGIGADILLGNNDNYISSAQNFNVYFPSAGGPMRWVIWDVSLTFGVTPNNALMRTGASRPLVNRFMNDPALKQDYLRALWFMYRAHYADDWIMARIDSLQALITPHMNRDVFKLEPVTSAGYVSLKSAIRNRRAFADGPEGFSGSLYGITPETAIRGGDVVVNELSPAAGWVELYNARDYSIDVAGHALSDGTQPATWTFPLRSFIPPRGRLLVRLQGGALGEAGPANFALPQGGGHLRLIRESGSVVDSLTYGAQRGDSAIARVTDGAPAFRHAPPTPGLPNVAATATGLIARGAVTINEFMADNNDITAPAGVQADWIELRNNTATPLDLSGAFLSDNAGNPAKWTFPAGTAIAANGYLIVWAYDTTATNALYARWALSKDGEHIRLSNTDQTVVDSVTFGGQARNRTTARMPDGTGPFASECLPTLGAANACHGTSLARAVTTPDLELARGLARVRLPAAGLVRLRVLDTRGREVAVLMNRHLAAGAHTVTVDAGRLPAGVHLFRLEAAGRMVTRTMVILR